MANATAEHSKTWSARLPSRLHLSALLLCLAGTATAALPLPEMSHSMTKLSSAKPARNFTLPDLDGKPRALSDYLGKVVLVNFWATWCPPCRREMPSLERLSQRLKDRGFVVLAINQMETPDEVFAFTGQLEPSPTFPLLFDRDSAVARAWGVLGLPASFIVDRQGRVVYRMMGGREFDHPQFEQAIRTLQSK